jgi:alkylation response protein AidB-like acyl-CoA dehydrogenase
MRPLALNDDQRQLAEAAAKVIDAWAREAGITGDHAKPAHEKKRDTWREMAALGWLGMLMSEADGGLGMGLMDAGVVLEQLGAAQLNVPYVSTVLLASELISRAATGTLRTDHLKAIAAGRRIVAVAVDERRLHDRTHCAVRAELRGDTWFLDGRKSLVHDAPDADAIIVIARTSGKDDEFEGRTAFVVDRHAEGMELRALELLNHERAADLSLSGVAVRDSDRIGPVGGIGSVLDPVLDRAIAGQCAAMLGGVQSAFARTADYLRIRQQFGVPLASFQGLQHRLATWWCEIEMTRSIVWDAMLACDEERPDAALVVSAAKAAVSDLFIRSGAEAIQLHGGIGMTADAGIGLFVKEARVSAARFGDAFYHRRRFARINGY